MSKIGSTPLQNLNALWFGNRLRYLEQLSIASALAQGHRLTIFSYEAKDLQGVPAGVEVADAREVMSDPRRTKLFEGKFKALGSDFFRYEIFQKELGYWMDLDVILLKPLSFTKEHVFGWEVEDRSINGAVLRIPRGSPMLDELRSIPERNWCPPYFGPKRRAQYYIARLLRGDVELEQLPWGVAGPAMITHLARKLGLAEQAEPTAVFYPVPYNRAEALFDDAAVVNNMVRPETVAIHMWNSRLRAMADKPPPSGSFIAGLCAKLGVNARGDVPST